MAYEGFKVSSSRITTATSSALGGVITGSNITNTSGTISLTSTNVTTALGFTPASGFSVVVQTTGTSLTAVKNNIYVINLGTPAAFTVNLPSSPASGDMLHVKDGAGNAVSFHITLQPASGNIEGQSNAIIKSNFTSVQLVYNGTQWNII